MKTFIGIDVSLKTSAICVLDERGKVLKEAEVASDLNRAGFTGGPNPPGIADHGQEDQQESVFAGVA